MELDITIGEKIEGNSFVSRLAFSKEALLRELDEEENNSVSDSERMSLIKQFYCESGDWLFSKLSEQSKSLTTVSEWINAAKQMLPSLFFDASSQTENTKEKQLQDQDAALFVHHILKSNYRESFTLSLLQPSKRALAMHSDFETNNGILLDRVQVSIDDEVATVTFLNTHCLNAEDNELIQDLELAIDLILLSNVAKVGVLRGGEVLHHKYAGKRVFSAGINLKYLATSGISFVDFLLQREFGYINKLLRGLRVHSSNGYQEIEKPWLAAVDSFAIGGGMQLLLACDKVIAERGSYVCLPAAKEGIVPGVANLRLSNLTSTKLAQKIILQGQKIDTDHASASSLFDEVYETEKMDEGILQAAAALNSEAILANRKMLRHAFEPLEEFMSYMADFSLLQVERMYSSDVLHKSFQFTKKN